MPLTTAKANDSRAARARKRASKRILASASVPAALVLCRHIAWDGHDLVVISRFDVIRG